LVVSLLPLTTDTTPVVSAADKMKAEDVVAKHLESIGSDEARSSVNNLIVAGTSRAVFNARNNASAIDGRVVIASEQNKVLYGMAFPAPNYTGEKFGFDGKKFTVGYLKPGIRSTLESFILTHDTIFKEGLMGGTLSSAWPLLNLTARKAKLEYAGTEKIGDRMVHKLKYSPNKGSDLEISLYFDTTTFQHVRTQYDRVAGAKLNSGGVDNQASAMAPRYRMTEDFSDFRQEGKLSLPHSYKLRLDIENTNGTSSHRWEAILDQFGFNQAIDAKSFNVEAQ
jgi:hypothetical protein